MSSNRCKVIAMHCHCVKCTTKLISKVLCDVLEAVKIYENRLTSHSHDLRQKDKR